MTAIADHIVHLDKELVVVDKPYGFISGGPDRQFDGEAGPRQSIEGMLVRHFKRQVWTVHQLDRNTTGLNCFVRNASLVRPWNDRLKVPGTKRYLAIVHGTPKVMETIVDVPLGDRVDSSGKTFPAVMPLIHPTAKPARSRVRFLATANGFSVAEVQPETGRTHQVRLHARSVGHPLAGDRNYATGSQEDDELRRLPRQMLHAWRLGWTDEQQNEIRVEAPWPDDFRKALDRLGLRGRKELAQTL